MTTSSLAIMEALDLLLYFPLRRPGGGYQTHSFGGIIGRIAFSRCRLRTPDWYAIGIDGPKAKRLAIGAGDLGPCQAIDVCVKHALDAEHAYVSKGPDPNARADTLVQTRKVISWSLSTMPRQSGISRIGSTTLRLCLEAS